MSISSGWIGVDLDGTLAECWPGELHDIHHIGKPIPLMVERVKKWLSQGMEVRIVTARAHGKDPLVIACIHEWLIENIGQVLQVTNEKDYDMLVLWDDRAIAVERNTGKILGAAACLV